MVPVPAIVRPPVSLSGVNLSISPSAYIMPAEGPPMPSTCMSTSMFGTSTPRSCRNASAASTASCWDWSISCWLSPAYSSAVCPIGTTASFGMTTVSGSNQPISATIFDTGYPGTPDALTVVSSSSPSSV